MKRTWPGEKIAWTRKRTDKLAEYWTGCGENYYYEIHKSTALGWKLYERRGVPQNPLQMVGTSPTMKDLRIFAERRDSSL